MNLFVVKFVVKFDCPRTCPHYEEKAGKVWPCRFNSFFDVFETSANSHVAAIKCNITSLDQLEAAAKACGLVLKRGQTTYKWYGRSVGDYALPEGRTREQLGTCDHALSMPDVNGAYEIGVIAKPDGKGFYLEWDFWSGGHGVAELAKRIGGNGASKLLEEYTFAAAEIRARELGWHYERNEQGLTVFHPGGGELRLNKTGEIETFGFQGGACHEARKELGVEVDESSIVTTGEGCQVPAVIQNAQG